MPSQPDTLSSLSLTTEQDWRLGSHKRVGFVSTRIHRRTLRSGIGRAMGTTSGGTIPQGPNASSMHPTERWGRMTSDGKNRNRVCIAGLPSTCYTQTKRARNSSSSVHLWTKQAPRRTYKVPLAGSHRHFRVVITRSMSRQPFDAPKKTRWSTTRANLGEDITSS